MRCAACGEETAVTVCVRCGEEARLGGRYRLEAVVGQGASGTVFRGVDVTTGAPVAVKEMAFRIGGDEKVRDLVAREGRVLRQLRHPGIPRWLDEVVAGTGRARALFLVQEFVDGRSLADGLVDRRWSEGEALALMAEVLPILTYLHTRHPPVIHRDLKPGNLLRRVDGQVVLVDFGSVRDMLASSSAGGSTVAGTFGFMAPEQFRGHAEPATDLYALGVSVVALLSRQDPATLHDRSGRLRWEPAVSVSAGLHDLLSALLAPDPAARPPSAVRALAWVEALQAGARGGPVGPSGAPVVGRAAQAPRAAPLWQEPPAPGSDPPGGPVPFEPPAPVGPPPAPGHRARGGHVRRHAGPVMGITALLLLAVFIGAFLMFSVQSPVPAPPIPAVPRPMPVPEARPVPELQGHTLLPSSDAEHGTSRCVGLGGRLGTHPDALPEAPGGAVVISRPAVSAPDGLGPPGAAFTCALRFAVDPEGAPASVGISVAGCPPALQQRICDSADAWRFGAPGSAAADGGFAARAEVEVRVP